MGIRDARIDTYIAKSSDFAQPILCHLRELIHEGCPDVEETMKWSAPFFMYKGILCQMAAFKEHCAFGFWKRNESEIFGGDMAAKGKVAEAMGLFGRITSVKDLPSKKTMLGYIKRAAELSESGVKSPAATKPKPKKALVVPPYFTAALKKNKKATAFFEEFSESKKREYVDWLTEAKTEETREKRLLTAVEWISEGKTRHWKYAKC